MKPRKHAGKQIVDMSDVAARDYAEVERRREKTVEQQLRGLALAKGWKVTERRTQ